MITNIDGGVNIERRAIPSSEVYVGTINDTISMPLKNISKVFLSYLESDYFFNRIPEKIEIHRGNLVAINPFIPAIPDYTNEESTEKVINIQKVKKNSEVPIRKRGLESENKNPLALNSDEINEKFNIITSEINFKKII